MGDGDAAVREETGGPASQTRDPPAVSDKRGGDPHTHDHRPPSQGAHRECEPGGGPTGAERQHDGVGRGGQLVGELQSGEQVADDRGRSRAAAGNPATATEAGRRPPRRPEREGESSARTTAHHDVRSGDGRRGERAAPGGIGLGKLGEDGAKAEVTGVRGRG